MLKPVSEWSHTTATSGPLNTTSNSALIILYMCSPSSTRHVRGSVLSLAQLGVWERLWICGVGAQRWPAASYRLHSDEQHQLSSLSFQFKVCGCSPVNSDWWSRLGFTFFTACLCACFTRGWNWSCPLTQFHNLNLVTKSADGNQPAWLYCLQQAFKVVHAWFSHLQ